MRLLKEVLSTAGPVSKELFFELMLHGSSIQYNSKEVLLRSSAYFDKVWFVRTGLIRCFTINRSKEFTTYFYVPGTFIMGSPIPEKRVQNTETIQAIKPSTCYSVSLADLARLSKPFPEIALLFSELYSRHAKTRLEEAMVIRQSNPMQKCLYFHSKYPDLFAGAGRDHILSFLQIGKESYYKFLKRKNTRH